MTSNTATTRPDVYSRITDKIIADLEQGVRPWLKPWSPDHAAGKITRPLRHNGIPYKGINVIMLWSAAVTKGYPATTALTLQMPASAEADAISSLKCPKQNFPKDYQNVSALAAKVIRSRYL